MYSQVGNAGFLGGRVARFQEVCKVHAGVRQGNISQAERPRESQRRHGSGTHPGPHYTRLDEEDRFG